ncbi:hypothetical protein [Flavobacterium sp. 3HN19-14]|uniref:hypothetical protein n=1 Tax=Flavobacterium sp. 3HN19-14 TaxID=3448133 RepID=UPI003EE0F633
MTKKITFVVSFFIAVSAFGQNKKISLEDAVMQQQRLFRADKMLGFQWIPETNKYVYLADNARKLMTANSADLKAVELVTLADLNKAVGADLRISRAFNGKMLQLS